MMETQNANEYRNMKCDLVTGIQVAQFSVMQ